MIGIFYLSSRSSDESTVDSSFVTRVLCFILGIMEYADNELLNHLVRKFAHASEFCALAVFGLQFLIKDFGKVKKECFMAWGFATAYAITDELHQLFVPGRACQIKDVIIDSTGAGFGVLMTILIVEFIRRSRANGSSKNK